MGRYVHGDEDFSYEYAFGDQASELVYLASQSGAGRSALFLKLDVEEGEELFFVDEIVPLGPLDDPGEVYRARAASVARDIARDPRSLDSALESPLTESDLASPIRLHAQGTFVLRREEWPVLLGWINARLRPRLRLTLDDLAAKTKALSRARRALDPSNRLHGLVHLALALLSFAVAKDLDELGAEDDDPLFDAVVHDPAGPASAAELQASARSGADHERERFAALSSRSDGVILTPAPTSHGQGEELDEDLQKFAAETEQLFVTRGRAHLAEGNGPAALPYFVAALQRLPPSHEGTPALRAGAREALRLAEGAPVALAALCDVIERAPSVDIILATLHRLSAGLGLALELPGRLRHEALIALGKLAEEAGARRRALRLYGEALTLHDGAQARFRRAFLLDLLGRPRASINEYTRLLRLSPAMVGARYNRACEYARVGKVERALADLAKAIAQKPSYRESARTESYFDPIRADPRFERLVAP